MTSLVPRPLPDFISLPWRKIGRRPGTNTTSRTGNAEGKRVTPCQSKCLHSAHCPQEGSESGLNGLDDLYIPTSSLVLCFPVLEDSGTSAETCLETE